MPRLRLLLAAVAVDLTDILRTQSSRSLSVPSSSISDAFVEKPPVRSEMRWSSWGWAVVQLGGLCPDGSRYGGLEGGLTPIAVVAVRVGRGVVVVDAIIEMESSTAVWNQLQRISTRLLRD